MRLRVGWSWQMSQRGEDPIESGPFTHRGEPVPGSQQVGRRFSKGLLLIGEQFQSKPGVQFGIVHAPALQLPVLVVLDQMMIGIARERQGIESERVHSREPQQT